MSEIMLVALAGAAGTVTRFGIDRIATHSLSSHGAVYATIAINLVGALLMGLLLGLAPGGAIQTALGVGFLGAFTTFSTLVLHAVNALNRDAYSHGIVLVGSTVALGILALYAGELLGRRLAT
jgi:fluoride exporter